MASGARPALRLATAAMLAACIGAAACARASSPSASGPPPRSTHIRTDSVQPAPPAGSRAEAHALATALLSRLRLPAGARPLPPNPAPRSVAPSLWAGAAAALDMHELFELPESMAAAAAFLTGHVPAGMSISVTGQGGGPEGPTSAEVAYAPRSIPAGINAAQLVLTVAPDTSGGSTVRADAQVIWYPPRTAAEYIDPARFSVLTIAVTVFNPRVHTITKVLTARAAITQLAGALNRSPVEPTRIANCPLIFASYRVAFAVSLHSAPIVVVTATQNPCLGAQITVAGQKQPPLQDEAAVVAIADRMLGFTPRP